MAAGDTMQGRRRSDVAPWDLEAGDYMLNAEGHVWLRLPDGTGPSLLKEWTVTEHEDETVTLSPSILDGSPDGDGWHGYLERGVWRQV